MPTYDQSGNKIDWDDLAASVEAIDWDRLTWMDYGEIPRERQDEVDKAMPSHVGERLRREAIDTLPNLPPNA